ncbi:MAG TPA: carboxypeptidase-like regulatory domain-containing protein [Acidimicrobiales bacterium]|nr:carboxypeptidase-like regulatory domain-containing protein [Acidimicrobiales bacterium]
MRRRRSAPLVLALAAVSVLVAGGCGGVESLSFGKPPPAKAGAGNQGPALPGNLDAVGQAHVAGATTTTVPPIGPGKASILGTVFGPNGPIGGATVEADRLVGNQVATTTVTSAADGSFVIGSILGGRYRVRAWQSPTLALTEPQIFFLGDAETHQVQLHLDSYTGPDVATSVNPGVAVVGQPVNLVVEVTNPTVDRNGIVRNQPVAGLQVTLASAGWTVYSGNPQTTGSNGQALFQLSCSSAGDNPLSVEIGSGAPQPVSVPSCVEPTTTTQCTPTGSGSGGTGGSPGVTTTTTQPNGGC